MYEYKYVLLDAHSGQALSWQRGNNSVLALRAGEDRVEVGLLSPLLSSRSCFIISLLSCVLHTCGAWWSALVLHMWRVPRSSLPVLPQGGRWAG